MAGILTDAIPGSFRPEVFYLVGTVPDVDGPLADHANEYTWFQTADSSWQFCVPNDGDKLTIAGSCAIGCWDADEEEWVYDGIAGITYTGLNLGPGVPVFEQVTAGGEFQFHTLLAGTNITLFTLPDGSIRISAASGGGSGEVNAGFNVGGGVGVYRNKTGVLLNFKSLVSTNPALTITGTANTVEFGLTFPVPPAPIVYYGLNLPDVFGGGLPIFAGNVANALTFNQWALDSEDTLALSVSLVGNTIRLYYSPGFSSVATWGDMINLYGETPVQGSVIHWNAAGVGGWETGNIAMNNVGTGTSIYRDSLLTSPTLQYNFRKILAGANVSVGIVGDDIVISAAGAAYTGLNLGAGSQVFSGIVGTQFQFRSLVMGTNMSAVQTANDITINTTAELNSAANVGGGTNVYTGKVGPVFQLRTFGSSPFISVNVAADLITFSPNPVDFIRNDTDPAGNELVIDAVGAPYLGGTQAPFYFRKLDATGGVAGALVGQVLTFSSTVEGVNLGGGIDVYKGLEAVTNNLEFYSFVAGTNMTITLVGDTIVFASTGGGGGGPASALVSYNKSTGTTTLPLDGSWTDIPFNATVMSDVSVTKSPDTVLTFNDAGLVVVDAKVTLVPGSSQVQHMIRILMDSGAGYVEVASSLGYAHTPSDYLNDKQTIHTGAVALSVAIGDKIKVQVSTNGGTVAAVVGNSGTSITIFRSASSVGVSTLPAASITTALTPTAYTPATADVEAHLVAINTALPISYRKTSDQNITSITLVDVTDLSAPMLANTDYEVEAIILHTRAASTSGIWISANGPALPTKALFHINTSTSSTAVVFAQSAYDGGAATTSMGVNGQTILKGIVRNGVNAGNLVIRAASEDGGQVTVQIGSFLKLRRLN